MVGGSVGNYLTGVIAEVILYNRPLTASERQKIEGYLAWKWGLTGSLPTTHPFKNYRPINGLSVPIPISYTNPKRTVNLDPFNPRTISGCQLWFDASDPNANRTLLSDGVGVATWTDKSSNAYTVSQTTSGNRPIFRTAVQNNLPGIQFQTNTFLSNLSVNMPRFTQGGGAGSVFIAARNASTNAGWNIVNTVWFDSGGGDSAALRRYHFSFNQASTAGTTLYVNNGASFALVGQDTGNAVSPNANAILGFTISPSSTTINTNGNSVSYTGFALQDITNNTGLFIFGDNRNNSSIASNIMIFEMVGYNTQLTTAQRQQVEGYLAWKWGLTSSLPANHPFKNPLAPFPPISIPRKGGERFFNPRTISGIQLWLDAADVNGNGTQPANGASISTWVDKSGNGRNFLNSASLTPWASAVSNRPTYTNNGLNGLSVVSFLSSSSQSLAGPDFFTALQNFTCFYVGTVSMGRGLDGYGNGWSIQSGFLAYVFVNSGAASYFVSPNPSSSPLYTVTLSQTTTSQITVWNCGTLAASSNVNNRSLRTSSVGFTLGVVGNSTIFVGGYMGEYLLFTSILTTSQRQQIEGYLAWKWKLQGNLPSTHPFKLFPPSP
jgi:hypothetical protein